MARPCNWRRVPWRWCCAGWRRRRRRRVRRSLAGALCSAPSEEPTRCFWNSRLARAASRLAFRAGCGAGCCWCTRLPPAWRCCATPGVAGPCARRGGFRILAVGECGAGKGGVRRELRDRALAFGAETGDGGCGFRSADSGWRRTVLRCSFLLGPKSFHLQQNMTRRAWANPGCLIPQLFEASEVHRF